MQLHRKLEQARRPPLARRPRFAAVTAATLVWAVVSLTVACWAAAAKPQASLDPVLRRGDVQVIAYTLEARSSITIAVFDLAGRRLTTLEHSVQNAGKHELTWKPSGLAQGLYFCQMTGGGVTMARPLLILK